MVEAQIQELRQLLPRCMLHEWVRLGSRLGRLLRDRHHLSTHAAVIERLLERARASVELREWRRTHVPHVSYPPGLPISQRKDELIAAIRSHQVIVVAGETGSGKTTQIPKMCLEAGLGVEARIGCTQPRRVAALSVSRRIAEELNVEWGREVGCKIRFDDRSSAETFVKLMTDGMLLAEVQGDPLLTEYNAIVLDEAHERSLNIDFLLGHLKGLLARRDDLKLIITSATIDTAAFSRAFNDAPVIEVSGRMFPVEVRYEPINTEEEERGDFTYVDATVNAAVRIVEQGTFGDILAFLPSERDIREASDQLESRLGSAVEVIPLFGRLASSEQQRVFAPGQRRRIVVATNIAETSLTIPGIRYVVDSGLARISRYSPRTRTRRLPIEPISQSSANQRKGRAGRVQDGVCIRLYSEEDFLERPAFTQPEIQRSNLAEVILRMKAFHLGNIEEFPFINPPPPAAIKAGYDLLFELGALDSEGRLTTIGQDLARLPIDPTLGRMVLQSQAEHATRELLIIASGLSIQDPRERPMDQQAAADTAHRRYADPRSDFLTLLNIWNAVHDQWEALRTQNQRRKFCRANFLSYTRMREWQDLHAQLWDALEELGTLHLNESNAAYDAIHRSILSGLLAHVGRRERRNQYRGAQNRLLTIFPGSSLAEKGEKPTRGRAAKSPAPEPAEKTKQPLWIMAGEIVETSQVFARTVAAVEAEWIAQLGAHLCQRKHVHPRWDARAGRVLVDEITFLHGLEVQRRRVAYGNLNPQDATSIFIRSALVEEELLPQADADHDDDRERLRPLRVQARVELPARYRFLAENRRVRERIESYRTRLRRSDLAEVDEALFRFYSARIENVSSREELDRLLGRVGPMHLRATEEDLLGKAALSLDASAFPDSVSVEGHPLEVSYAYAPGEEWDGVTIKLPEDLARQVPAAVVEWAVPSLRKELVTELMQALPKALRRELQPFAPKVEEIVRDLQPAGASLSHELSRFIKQRWGVNVPPAAWRPEGVPAHLRPRLEVLSGDHKPVASGRDMAKVREALSQVEVKPATASDAWRQAAEKWERDGCTDWSFGDLPERVPVEDTPKGTIHAWPGLVCDEAGVGVRLFRVADAARESSLEGVRRLIEILLSKEFAWLQRDLRGLSRFDAAYATVGSPEELRETAFANLRRYVLPSEPLPALTEANFRGALERSRHLLPGLAKKLVDRLTPIFQMHAEIARRLGVTAAPNRSATPTVIKDFSQLGATRPAIQAHPLAGELKSLVPSRFLEQVSFERLPHLPRYLKALLLRIERAAANPLRDRERSQQIAPYVQALAVLQRTPNPARKAQGLIEEFRWLVEEFKVSLHAQELGTAVPVSPKRLDQFLQHIRENIV